MRPIHFYVLVLSVLLCNRPVFGQNPSWTPSIETTHISDGVYVIRVQDNERGGYDNSVVSVGEDGIILVDHSGTWSKMEVRKEIRDLMLEEMKRLGGGDGIPDYVITTHWHGDHSSGTLLYGENAVSISQEHTYQRLAAPQQPDWLDQPYGPFAGDQLPDITFSDSLTLRLNNQTIQLYHFGPSHTDGDAIVYFKEAGLIHMSDLFQSHEQPILGINGSGVAYTYQELIKRIPERQKNSIRIVTGHNTIRQFSELEKHAALYADLVTWIQKQVESDSSMETILQGPFPESLDKWEVDEERKKYLVKFMLDSYFK